MADSGKRKAEAAPSSSRKKKKGNNGKWRAPKKEGSDRPKANAIEPGDMGIWVTCAMHQKGRAAREMELLFDEYAEKIYGIKSGEDSAAEEDDDIEAAIRKEVGSLKDRDKRASDGVFTEVRTNQECLLFMRCRAPVEPVEFCRRICLDAAATGHGGVRARYLNRLTPMSVIVKATEGGLEDGARRALAGHLKLKPKEGVAEAGDKTPASAAAKEAEDKAPASVVAKEAESKTPASFAIRPSIRNHNTLRRDDVIKGIANLVDPQHKVNLGAPDKTVLVDIYQTVCGFSVVPDDYDKLKRYNLTELYKLSTVDGEGAGDVDEGETPGAKAKDGE